MYWLFQSILFEKTNFCIQWLQDILVQSNRSHEQEWNLSASLCQLKISVQKDPPPPRWSMIPATFSSSWSASRNILLLVLLSKYDTFLLQQTTWLESHQIYDLMFVYMFLNQFINFCRTTGDFLKFFFVAPETFENLFWNRFYKNA
jgi:hypothetical protein